MAAGVIGKIRGGLVPKATMGLTLALLVLRLTVGWGMFEAGKGKVHKLMGTCTTDPLPDCEADLRADCKDDKCKAEAPGQCAAQRKAECKRRGEQAVQFFGTLTIAGVEDLTLPGGGELNMTAAALAEAIFGILLMLGLLTRIAAAPLLFTMTIAMLTAHWDSFGPSMAFVSEMAFVYWACLWVLIAQGPGNFSIDRMLAKP